MQKYRKSGLILSWMWLNIFRKKFNHIQESIKPDFRYFCNHEHSGYAMQESQTTMTMFHLKLQETSSKLNKSWKNEVEKRCTNMVYITGNETTNVTITQYRIIYIFYSQQHGDFQCQPKAISSKWIFFFQTKPYTFIHTSEMNRNKTCTLGIRVRLMLRDQ